MIEDLDLQNTDKAFDAFKCTLGPTLKTTWTSIYDDDPIHDLTSAAAYAIRATVHGTTKHMPSQLVYAKDMILQMQMEANVEHV